MIDEPEMLFQGNHTGGGGDGGGGGAGGGGDDYPPFWFTPHYKNTRRVRSRIEQIINRLIAAIKGWLTRRRLVMHRQNTDWLG